MDLQQLFIFSLICLGAIIVWRHLEVSRLARELVASYCDKQNLLLLDQSVILKKIRLIKSNESLIGVERRYNFEFSTVGDTRYTGQIVFHGKKMKSIELDAFRM